MAHRIEGEARQAVIRAQEQARRLGQHFVGCEHLLYGIAGADDAAGGILRARGVTPERVEAQVAELIAHGRGSAGRSPELDHDALHAIGVDLETVRSRVEQAFGPGALERARTGSGRRGRPDRRLSGHLRVTRQARACLKRSIRATGSGTAGGQPTARIALILLAMNASALRRVLAGLGVSAPELTAELRSAL